MALFKIFNNFDNPDHTLPTSTHKGYCYFDVKTKLFWIDIADSNGVTLTSENISNYRVPLNANLAAAAGLLVNENGEWSSVPEKTSDLINDSGFLTSFTETDPTVPSWAKASTKPTYTASEIQGALTSFYLDQPKIPEPGPYPNIQLALGSSYSIKDQNNGTIQNFIMPSVPTWALAENKPTYTATEVGALPSNTTYVSSVNGQSGAVTITDSDEKVKHTDLNGTNSGKPVLLAATMLSNGNSRTETVYSSTKLMWNDYSPNLSIYNSDRSKYSSISATRIGLANSSTAYTGALSLSTLSSDRTYTLPNKSGTIALTTDIPTAVTESTVSGWGFTKNTGTITGVSVNGTSVATSGVANITSIPASILSGTIPSDVTATTQANSDNSTKIATTAFVKTAISGLIGPMMFKGTLGTGGTITTLPTAAEANTGFTYKVITDGTYASIAAKVGDLFISNGSEWIIVPSGDETFVPTLTSTSDGQGHVTLGVTVGPMVNGNTMSF